MDPLFSVIMPAYNEGQCIYINLHKVCQVLKSLNYEIIVVDDGSRDNTFTESQRASGEGLPIRVIQHPVNRGKGAAFLYGFGFSSGQIVAFFDSDLEIAPEYLPRLLETMQAKSADVVIGVKELTENNFPLLRRILSMVYRVLVKFIFGLSLQDSQTGIKIFKRDVLETSIPCVKTSRFAFDIELLISASRLGCQIAEYPVKTTYSRVGLIGRIGFKQMVQMLADLFAIYYRASFWQWLRPGLETKLWMITFVVGIFLCGIGISKLVTPLIPQPWLKPIIYIMTLQFLPITLRDWLLVIIGVGLLVLALLKLNNSLLNAFSRRDRGDLAGLFRRK